MEDSETWTCGCLYECHDCEIIRKNGGNIDDIRKHFEDKDMDYDE